MKYLNSLVFLGLIAVVAGCQKKDQVVEVKKSSSHQTSAHEVKGAKQGPTKLETKKSVSYKSDENGSESKSVVVKKSNDGDKVVTTTTKSEKSDSKKAAPHKSRKKVADDVNDRN